MKTFWGLGRMLVLLLLVQGAGQARGVRHQYEHRVNSNSVTVVFTPEGETPEWMAAVVRTNRPGRLPVPREDPGYKNAQWLPFKTNMIVNLGAGDGQRSLMFGFRYKGETNANGWSGSTINVESVPPQMVITNPKEHITSQPMIQLKGYVSRPVENLKYDLYDQNGVRTVSGGDGLVNDQYHDPILFEFTTNYFTCYDVSLSPGTNTFVVHGVDFAGNAVSTNFVIVFTTAGDTTPPVFSVTWPQDGTSISGSVFDLYGRCDDPTAVVTGLLCNDEGKASHLNGAIERNGCLWIERVPLAQGKNYLTIVTTDAAQNSSLTNLTFTQSRLTLYMDPFPDPNKLWQSKINITGFCSDTNRTVMVSGVKAKMKPDGHWEANDVPVNSPNGGGTATFDLSAQGDQEIAAQTNAWLPTICGEPVESHTLSAGFSLVTSSTNEYNHYSICLGLTNQSGRRLPNIWMLPAEDARYAIRLYDQSDREVVSREFIGKSGQSLATNLNIHHLGKKELEAIEGIISFSTNSTVRLASFNLDQHFQLPAPGQYRLEIVARMFKIAGDGQLVPVELPPIATAIKIIDQPSEMFFYLRDLQRQGRLTWGAERYGLRVGVVHGTKWNQIEDAKQIQVFLQNSSTNNYHNWNLRLPKSDEQFDVTLYDVSGKEVPKTTLGKQQGQPLSLDGQNLRSAPGLMDQIIGLFGGSNGRRGRGLRPLMVSANDATDCGQFNLNDYFEIKAPGHYQLTYQQRLYRSSTNFIVTGIILPMVKVPLDITNIPGQ